MQLQLALKEVIKSSWPTLVIVVAILGIMRATMLIKGSGRRNNHIYEEIFGLFFVFYLLVLFQLVTDQDISIGHPNLVPFKEILRYEFGSTGFYKQVIGNILLFIPLGYFITSYCKLKGLGSITLISAFCSATIEIVQHFIGRSFDVDDIILNVVGGIIGFLLYISLNAIRNHLPKILRKDWFLNILSIIVLVLFVLYLIKIF